MQKKVVVIAHRGASGYLPEHTIQAKIMAHGMNVDFLEQDLVLSKDDVPIVIHDIYLDDVTNVATVFPDKKRADGRFYVIDFTFDELKQLLIYERFNPQTGDQIYPNRYSVKDENFRLHSLQEELQMIQNLNKSTGKNIGIYPEIKEPQFHLNTGKDISKIVLKILEDFGYKTKKDNCILQCFDAKELKRIRTELSSELFLVQLIEFEEETQQLAHFATYADGVGPWYQLLFKEKNSTNFEFNNFVEEAHKLGLQIHIYTLRADQLDAFENFEQQMEILIHKGNVDGVFTDFPDKVIAFLAK